jgi:hypothetical protein
MEFSFCVLTFSFNLTRNFRGNIFNSSYKTEISTVILCCLGNQATSPTLRLKETVAGHSEPVTCSAGGASATLVLPGHQLMEENGPAAVLVILRPELAKLDIVAIDGSTTASLNINQVHTIQVHIQSI